MIQITSKAKIFLADDRGCTQSHLFRSYHTFNYGSYVQPHKTPFGSLHVLNDDTLAGGQYLTVPVEEDSTIFLLPIVGAIVVKDSIGYSQYIEAGECRLLEARKSTSITFRNPYDDALVNFLQLWIHQPVMGIDNVAPIINFDASLIKNFLSPLTPPDGHLHFYIGKFDGREEVHHKLRQPTNAVFVFVIDGAFEVNGRLLHARDGLGLWETNEIEMEALSNDAIVLLAAFPWK